MVGCSSISTAQASARRKIHLNLANSVYCWTNLQFNYAIIFSKMLETAKQPPTPVEQEKIKNEASWVELLKSEIGRVIVGQKYLVDRLIIGLLANGHVLLEGVPGLAKTLAVKLFHNACVLISSVFNLHRIFFRLMFWAL